MRALFAAGLVLVLAALMGFWRSDGRSYPHKVLVRDEPLQKDMDGLHVWHKNGYKLSAQAEFEIKGLLISRRNYWFDREAQVSPLDFCLSWGLLSNQKFLKQLKFSQSDRFCRYYSKNLPLSLDMIDSHIANLHLIPASDSVRRQLKRLKKHGIVRLTGKLVNIEADDGWRWKTSLTRTDTGYGACEILWVEEASAALPDL